MGIRFNQGSVLRAISLERVIIKNQIYSYLVFAINRNVYQQTTYVLFLVIIFLYYKYTYINRMVIKHVHILFGPLSWIRIERGGQVQGEPFEIRNVFRVWIQIKPLYQTYSTTTLPYYYPTLLISLEAKTDLRKLDFGLQAHFSVP